MSLSYCGSFNNRVTFHERTDYQDHGEWGRRRHLMRLWLRVPEWPPLPESQRFSTDEDQRMWSAKRTPLKELPSAHFEEIRVKGRAIGYEL